MHSEKLPSLPAPVFSLTLGACILIYILNLRLDVMEVDAAQYASIGMEMLMNGSWLEVYHRGADYLDKPPLLFWLNAASMALFGINSFAAKLPGTLALLLSLFSLFRFCQIWYNEQTAKLACLVLASSQAFFLMSNDVKTDGLLTGFIMLALWQGSVLLKERSRSSIMLFSLALALALMTKGPLGFILPCGAIGLHLILTRQLKLLLRKELLLILPLVVLLISPMCIGLYEQFDMHPEKEVYGLKGPSGLRFFFYTQSFGRLTGEIYWNNGAPWYFFLLSMLWDFAPWVLLFWWAIISMIKNSAHRKQMPEFMSIALFLTGMLGLSASNYKLPHYIFPLFPACAITVAVFLLQQQTNKILKLSLKILALLFSIVPVLAFTLIFKANMPAWLFALMNLFCVVYFGFLLRKELWALFISLSAFGMVLSLWFYPELLGFQSSSTAGHYISENSSPSDNIFLHQVHGHALDFYSGRISRAYNKEATRRDWIYTTQSHGDSLLRSGDWELKADMNDFHISRLSGKFLFSENKKTYCKKIYLMQKIK